MSLDNDHPLQQNTTPPQKKGRRSLPKRKVALSAFIGGCLIIGLVYLIFWLIWGRFAEYTDDAYVNGNMVAVMAQVSGTVTKIYTDDTALVQQGQLLIQLDDTNARLALARAEAGLAQTLREVRQYFADVARTQATLTLRQADLVKANLDYQRRLALRGRSAVSHEELQHYKTTLLAMRQQVIVATENKRAALALTAHTNLYHHPRVKQAQANLRNKYLDLKRTTILAPTTGVVAKRSVQIGQEITPTTPLLAIIPLYEVWVDANYKESQLQRIRINQAVTLSVDAYPDFTFHGHVQGINAGTGTVFSLLPAQNATGNWIKIVQRLPVRIALDPRELQKRPLQLGLSMRVTTDVHDINGLILPAVNTQLRYSTPIYAQQLHGANKLIKKILQEN